MISKQIIVFILGSVLFLTSCEPDSPIEITPSNSINTIMPLGASRVEGARPHFESYRYELWKLLVDGGWDFDYIGTKQDDASYPAYSSEEFDVDHEGRGGWTSGQILEGINEWLALTGAPDIVLFSSPGGNDALTGLPYEDIITNVHAIIDAIQDANPNVTIIIERMAPARSDKMTAELTSYFTQMQQDVVVIADQQTTPTSTVVVVDMATGFNDSHLADDVHYNELGASLVANRYYDVLVNILKQ